jgi:hypothetical protein
LLQVFVGDCRVVHVKLHRLPGAYPIANGDDTAVLVGQLNETRRRSSNTVYREIPVDLFDASAFTYWRRRTALETSRCLRSGRPGTETIFALNFTRQKPLLCKFER